MTDRAGALPHCGDYLMESDWQEGFECSLVAGHQGPHRCESGTHEVNESTSDAGRRYQWVQEWRYLDDHRSA